MFYTDAKNSKIESARLFMDSFPELFSPELFRIHSQYNASQPRYREFITQDQEHEFVDRFLSVNPEDNPSIWTVLKTEKFHPDMVPVAITDNKKYICMQKNTDKTYLADPKEDTYELLANTFDMFIFDLDFNEIIKSL